MNKNLSTLLLGDWKKANGCSRKVHFFQKYINFSVH